LLTSVSARVSGAGVRSESRPQRVVELVAATRGVHAAALSSGLCARRVVADVKLAAAAAPNCGGT